MTDIKLLTEAEVRGYFKHNPCADVDAIIEGFRERGLIADEPVHSLLVEAREIVVDQNLTKYGEGYHQAYLASVPKGERDDAVEVRIALAALRRGMELQRDKLTREVVWETMDSLDGYWADSFIDRLHAALLERLS